MTLKNPMQPVALDQEGVLRFKRNAIVSHLLDWASERGMGMNTLALMNFDDDDRAQFAQLIGYSVDGFADLSYVDEDVRRRVEIECFQAGHRDGKERSE